MAEIAIQTIEVDDFSGGKTDSHIAAQINQFEEADNLLLKQYGSKMKLTTRPGLDLYSEAVYRIPPNESITGLAECDLTLFQLSKQSVFKDGVEILGPTDNHALSAGDISSYPSTAVWNKHLLVTNDAASQPVKVYKDGTTWKLRTLGLPPITASITAALPTGTTDDINYLYAFHWADSYTAQGLGYREVGPTVLVQCAGTGSEIDGAHQSSISGLPTISNGATGNYNTTGIKIEIYRTQIGGGTFYKVGEVANGVTTFSDGIPDDELITQPGLYTDGGTVDFDPAPPSLYVLVANGTAFYLGVEEDGQLYRRKIRQSVTNAIYAAPLDFYDEIEDDITGGGVINSYPVIFSRTKTYRIEGLYDELGQGGFVLRLIDGSIGCISHRSIVAVKGGLFFASEQGFMFTDGFSVRSLSADFASSFQELMSSPEAKAGICGTYDHLEQRVLWGCRQLAASTGNDRIYVAHLKTQGYPFTTLSGGYNLANFSPASLLFFNGEVVVGDRRGFLLRLSNNAVSDAVIDPDATPDEWERRAIIYDYRSPAFDFGTTNIRKWVPRIVINADNSTNLSLQVQSNVDNGGIFANLSEIKATNNATWGDDSVVWSATDIRWNYSKVVSHWRRFPSPIRCVYRQIRMTNAKTLLDSSGTMGLATTNGDEKTVTLQTVGNTFGSDSIGYFISFSNDNYFREWEITSVDGNEVTVADPDGALESDTNRTWIIRGYAKNHNLNLLSYVIDFGHLTMTQQAFKPEG